MSAWNLELGTTSLEARAWNHEWNQTLNLLINPLDLGSGGCIELKQTETERVGAISDTFEHLFDSKYEHWHGHPLALLLLVFTFRPCVFDRAG